MARWERLALGAVLLAVGLGGAAVRAGEGDAPEKAGGLKATLAKKKITRRFRGRERTFDTLILTVTNEGKKTAVMPYPLPIKLHAKDAEGKEVAPREDPRAGAKKNPKRATTFAVLKPGQSLSADCRRGLYLLNFTAKGTYKVWAVVEAKPSDEEVLPGVKLWSGKLTSNEVEFTIERVRSSRGRPAQPKKEPKKKEPKKEPAKKTEDF
jgi:hypothetical protein